MTGKVQGAFGRSTPHALHCQIGCLGMSPLWQRDLCLGGQSWKGGVGLEELLAQTTIRSRGYVAAH